MKFHGVLFFPVTPFAADGSLDEERLARHIESGVAAGAGGVFVACGTGEFHALSAEEIERATRVAVETTVSRLLDEFYGPLVALRDEVPGYAVPLVKAGVTLRGLDVGGVRAPLLDPTPEHVARLSKLLDHGLEVVGA
ncbi:dihydrodipicolinate synthase family protein [Streptomyces sp. NRRL S-146]|uniref:dihydrodipicolinate synthase family protein n=1 Tax=Streptomyces sp. NRRL S-146 TaxID=1463884 RepID=UPI0004C8CBB5|nr:dihydrodipicolinate synthase family protein [Streptomyces sp. NRRL S-146]